jgi:hypothetical protein
MKISSVLCSIDGCDRPNRKRGWCEMHYSRWRRHGDPEHTDPTPEERFWSHVDVRGPDDCWPWTGCINSRGYGIVRWEERTQGAYRVAFLIAHDRYATRGV